MRVERARRAAAEDRTNGGFKKGDIVGMGSKRYTVCEWGDVIGRHVESPEGSIAGSDPGQWCPPMHKPGIVPYVRNDNKCVGWTHASDLVMVKRSSSFIQLELFEEKRERRRDDHVTGNAQEGGV